MSRPHWLPEGAWLGVKIGEWPLFAFTDREDATRWAAEETGDPGQRQRRIWPVEIPENTPTYKATRIPASYTITEASS